MSIDLTKLPHFFGKKHSYLVCLLLIYVGKYGLRSPTQEAMFDAWKKYKPSRTTFVGLLKDLEDIGVLKRSLGQKKSSIEVEVDLPLLLNLVGLRPLEDFVPSNCWVFKTGTFSVNAFISHDDFETITLNDKKKYEAQNQAFLEQ